MKYEEKYTADVVSRDKVKTVIDANISNVTFVRSDLEHTKITFTKYDWVAVALVLVVSVWIASTLIQFITISFLALSVLFILLYADANRVSGTVREDLIAQINDFCFVTAFKLFNIPIRKTDMFLGHISQILRESQLKTEYFKGFKNGDSLRFNIDNKQCSISEVMLGQTVGWLVFCETNKKLEGRTFISCEGEKTGFGHIEFWDRILKTDSVKETILEWNQFEKKLHVATSNPTEAREILTPNFMSQLYDWWSEQSEQNIRISFYDNKMAMLFPDPGINLYTATFKESISEKHVEELTTSIAKSSRHVLNLIDNVLIRVR